MTMTTRMFTSWIMALALLVGLFVVPPESASAEKIYHSVNRNVEYDVKDVVRHVVMEDDTVVRNKPSSKAKRVDKLEKGTILYVYEETRNGWSEINHKGRTAYVSTKDLQVTYGLNPSLTYTYHSKEHGKDTFKFKGERRGWNEWVMNGNRQYPHTEKEDQYGYHVKVGGAYSENATDLEYPVKKGLKWRVWVGADSYSNTIISVDKTIKIKAGTFRNVVAVKSGHYVNYYAPNVGFILTTYKGKAMYELVRLK